MSRSLIIFTLEDHPHRKQLPGQDNLGNFVARKRLLMRICTTPTKNSKKNTLSIEQPPIMPRATLESINPQHRNDDHHEDNSAGQNKMKRKLWGGLLSCCAISKKG